MLIERGADVTAQDKVRVTPLHLASFQGEVEVARMLIERGADVTAQNKVGTLHYIWHRLEHWRTLSVMIFISKCRDFQKFLAYCSRKAQM
jgi:ankyrin repeat protein